MMDGIYGCYTITCFSVNRTSSVDFFSYKKIWPGFRIHFWTIFLVYFNVRLKCIPFRRIIIKGRLYLKEPQDCDVFINIICFIILVPCICNSGVM
jgi:hypothetical protein